MPVSDIKARTAARKESGESQSYPQHAGKAARPKAFSTSLPVLKAAPCRYEGAVIDPCPTCSGEAKHVRDCDLHERCTRGTIRDARGVVSTRVQACDTCPQYTAPERKGDPQCGVAIGSYRWPELVDLQIRLIRATCGPVPILVSSDHPESADSLAAICAAHPDVTFVTNPERFGHTGGDLAVYHRGVTWGAERGLAVVAKLSQRLLFTRPFWLQDGAKELLSSGLGVATRACTGRRFGGARYPLRTEYALMDVSRWNRPAVLDMITPRRVWHLRDGGWPAEQVIAELVRDHFDGLYWPTAAIPPAREDRAAGVVWHHADPREAYTGLAAQLGVTLPADFHCDGWEGEYAEGKYLYG